MVEALIFFTVLFFAVSVWKSYWLAYYKQKYETLRFVKGGIGEDPPSNTTFLIKINK